MSATISTIIQPAGSVKPGVSLRILNAYWERIRHYLIRRAATAALHELDERMLQDLGIARSEIEAAVQGLLTPSTRARA